MHVGYVLGAYGTVTQVVGVELLCEQLVKIAPKTKDAIEVLIERLLVAGATLTALAHEPSPCPV